MANDVVVFVHVYLQSLNDVLTTKLSYDEQQVPVNTTNVVTDTSATLPTVMLNSTGPKKENFLWVGTFVISGTNVSIENITVVAPNYMGPMHLGPAKVIMYNNLAEGQGLQMNGGLLIAATPSQNLASYVNSDISRCVDSTALSQASILFNGKNPLYKRIWRLPEYEQQRMFLLQKLASNVKKRKFCEDDADTSKYEAKRLKLNH